MQHNQPDTSHVGTLPESSRVAASVGLPNREAPGENQGAAMSAIGSLSNLDEGRWPMRLDLQDGTSYIGTSFGAETSVSGELVFQTGMVGYPESITDPSYSGQILVITFPLIGNYGAPSREVRDTLLGGLPAYFEAERIHVAGLIVASYCGEDYSHHLAKSSLGTWLKEQGVPAMQGIDTRALTKRIRQEGSMLGRLLVADNVHPKTLTNGDTTPNGFLKPEPKFCEIDWVDPNARNLVADGEPLMPFFFFFTNV